MITLYTIGIALAVGMVAFLPLALFEMFRKKRTVILKVNGKIVPIKHVKWIVIDE
jgi:hypothetical protein